MKHYSQAKDILLVIALLAQFLFMMQCMQNIGLGINPGLNENYGLATGFFSLCTLFIIVGRAARRRKPHPLDREFGIQGYANR